MCYLLDYCKLHFYHHFSFFKKKICFIEFNLQILNCPYYFIQSFVCAFLDVSQVFIPVIFKFIHMFVSLLNSLNKFITILLNSLFSLGIIFMGLIIWVVAYSLFWGVYYLCCCERTQASGDRLLALSFAMFLAH